MTTAPPPDYKDLFTPGDPQEGECELEVVIIRLNGCLVQLKVVSPVPLLQQVIQAHIRPSQLPTPPSQPPTHPSLPRPWFLTPQLRSPQHRIRATPLPPILRKAKTLL